MACRRYIWMISALILCRFFSSGPAGACSAQVIKSREDAGIIGEFDLETEMLRLTNQHRALQGLGPVLLDEALSRIAREQSAGMARQGFISHELPSGDLAARMRGSGYLYEIARENLASSRSVARAQKALIQSPDHNKNILSADVDRIGIGVVRCASRCGEELYITQIFASPRRQYAETAVQDELMRRVDSLRQNGAGSLLPDAMLEKMASESVRALDVPVDRQKLRSLLADSAGAMQRNGRTEIVHVDMNVQVVRDPKNISIPRQADRTEQASMIGTAVRRVVNTANEPAFLVLTLIGFSQ